MTRQEANKSLKLCTCMHKPEIQENGWDSLQVVCPYCGKKGEFYLGDYYDEGFMFDTYGESAVKDWNENYSYEAERRKI